MTEPGRSTGWILWLIVLRAVWYSVPFLVLLFIALLVRFMLWPPTWQYTLSASTEVAGVDLPDARETTWRVDGALLCVPPGDFTGGDKLERTASSACGRWQVYRVAATASSELVLRLGGLDGTGDPGTIHALLEVQPDGALMLALRSGNRDRSLGKLHLVDGDFDAVLPAKANLVWEGDARAGHASVLVFPFQGELAAGRDVTWSYNRMLNGGRLSVYTASDKSAAKRVLVQEMDLMLGDQVRLEKTVRGSDTVWPRGHLRYVMTKPGEERAPSLEVAGIGLADSLVVERFGASQIEFRPGFWSRFMHDRLAIVSGLLIGLISIFSGYIGSAGFFVGKEAQCRGLRHLLQDCLRGTRHERGQARAGCDDSDKD
ncbi:MAG: hypothetical protein J5I92_01415 [Thiogranum sp.]|nr:hypothetical protein [Thiogranum sp.]